MSRELISRSADLRRLRDEGYFVQVRGGLLLLREVPYVDTNRRVRTGTLVSSLAMAGDATLRPDTHVVHFDGEYPCLADGSPIQAISHQSASVELGHGVVAKHSFSSKPSGGYTDYYDKMTTYAGILSGPATTLRPSATPRAFAQPDDDLQGVFRYVDTASARAGIGALTERLAAQKVAIIGLGGTGAYVLDLVAKTPVREIRVFDGDEFLQHNAFRSPGAAAIEQLREAPLKADYYKGVYSRMHRNIVARAVLLTQDTIHLLEGISFAFVCIDRGDDRRSVVAKLEELGVSFVDVGMGLEVDDGSLGGIVRVTTSTELNREHFHRGRVSFAPADEHDLYSSNIQVADLNALNAVLAVIKWKKLSGFYRDLEGEHHCTYTTDGNMLLNEVLA